MSLLSRVKSLLAGDAPAHDPGHDHDHAGHDHGHDHDHGHPHDHDPADEHESRHDRREAGRERHHETGEPAWEASDRIEDPPGSGAKNPDAAPEILGGN